MPEIDNSVKSYGKWFATLVGVVFLFRLWFITTLPLSGDEAYHWEWSRHPAFGYYDHPGLTAYLILFFTRLFGASTEFTVRLPALVMLTGTAVTCFFLAKNVVSDARGTEEEAGRAGFLAGMLVLMTPIYAVFSVYISTDPPLIFFWSLSLYMIYGAFSKGTTVAWLMAGCVVGLALMSKFLVFPLIPAVLLFMLISPDARKWFVRWQPYAAALCCLVVISPFLWWNYTHNWATFMFNFVYRQEEQGFHPENTVEFIIGQALAISPLILLAALAVLWWCVREWRRNRNSTAIFLGLTTLMPFLYFMFVSFRRSVGVHWPAAGWLGAIVLVACIFSRDWFIAGAKLARWFKTAAITICIVETVVIHLLVHVPPRWIVTAWKYKGDPERINLEKQGERFGWRELGQKVYQVRNEMQEKQAGSKRGVFVISDQYGLSSSIAFYTPDQMETHLWTTRKVHGENYRFWDDFSSMSGMDAIFVTKDGDNISAKATRMKDYFASVEQSEELTIVRDGLKMRSFYLIRCYKFRGVAQLDDKN